VRPGPDTPGFAIRTGDEEAVVTVYRNEGETGDVAGEHLRLDLAEARKQLAATSEVLSALGRSASDLDAILGTVVQSARSLCRADVAQIHLMEGELIKLARSSGLSQEGIDYMTRNPVRRDRGSLIGRVGLYGRTQQITDVVADADYGRIEFQRMTGLRTTLGVPMMLDDELIGVLNVWRNEVDPFGDRETELLTTFATQAAVAIRQVRLHRALEDRQLELSQKIEQLEALGEVGQAVSSSLDLDQVLATIIMHALRLLRESPSTRAVPVVAVTAFAMKEDRERAFNAGFDGYLEKPISVRALPEQVRGFLDGKGSPG
jgi:CheY-like chemotaxis protein